MRPCTGKPDDQHTLRPKPVYRTVRQDLNPRSKPSNPFTHPPSFLPPPSYNHITPQHQTPNSTPVVLGLCTLPASRPPILTPTLRNLHKRFLRKSGSSSPQSGQSQIGVKHGRPCKCGMLAGPLGCAAEKSGQVRRLWVGLQG